ncbi:hypothetical protein FS749_000924 [Ceratobasidium sp. UAMH 11750]|nr:hypothetical protein FS749_000924 [Ceratobasidium sp. UAMH 11750]
MTLNVAIMERQRQPLEGIEVTRPFCTLRPSFVLRECRVFRQAKKRMGWETAESSGVLECIAALRLTNEATSWSSSSLVRDPGLDAAAVAVALEALRK